MNRVRRGDIDLPASSLTTQLHEPRGQTGFQVSSVCQRNTAFSTFPLRTEVLAVVQEEDVMMWGLFSAPWCPSLFSRSGQGLNLFCPRLESSGCFLSPEITVYCRKQCSCWPRNAQLWSKAPLSHPEEASHPAGSLPQHHSLFCSGDSLSCQVTVNVLSVERGPAMEEIISWVPSAFHRFQGPFWRVCITKEPCGGTLCLPEAPNPKQSAGRECSIPATVSHCHGGDPFHQNSTNLGILALSPWTVTDPRQGFVNPPGCPKDIQGLSSCRMCRGAPGLCVPLMAPVPVSGLEKSCSAYALLFGEMSLFWFPSELRPFI